MSKKTLYLLGILITIILGMWLQWMFCCSPKYGGEHNATNGDNTTENASTTQVAPTPKTPTNNGFALKDGDGDFNFSSQDNFNFNVSGFNILQPISTQLDGGIDTLKAYLDANDHKEINITGLYTSGETNNSAYPNLGLARANAVKNYFSTHGINPVQMNTGSKLWDDMVPDNTIFKGPINFSMLTLTDEGLEEEAKEIAALEAKIKADPLVLHFKTGAASINLTAEQRQKVADITRYLDKKEGASITITGHTDNSGSRQTNLRLGQERADFAKGYFVRNGISENKVNTSSKGPDVPIATNDTEEGKSKNRRTEVTIN